MKLRIAAAGLVLFAAGCTSTPTPQVNVPTPGSPPAWTEPAAYRFVADRTCGTGPSQGRYRVTVRDGQVTGTERIDGRTATGEEEIQVPTLGELKEMATTATEDGAEATVSVDPADGHPTEVRIKRDTEECFVISEYAAG
ncbi:MAG TPA: DUF6174 domain-containing protein [Actinoplanes sp.]|nr:DUF6174 domain-containing protein [Actinoplanes sp.]